MGIPISTTPPRALVLEQEDMETLSMLLVVSMVERTCANARSELGMGKRPLEAEYVLDGNMLYIEKYFSRHPELLSFFNTLLKEKEKPFKGEAHVEEFAALRKAWNEMENVCRHYAMDQYCKRLALHIAKESLAEVYMTRQKLDNMIASFEGALGL